MPTVALGITGQSDLGIVEHRKRRTEISEAIASGGGNQGKSRSSIDNNGIVS